MRKFNYYTMDKDKKITGIDDPIEWAKSFERGNRRVDLTKVGNVDVSTVFLGIDHSWGDGPPVLFETMVFGGKLDQEQERYCTYDDAIDGHLILVEKVKRVGLIINIIYDLKRQVIRCLERIRLKANTLRRKNQTSGVR